MLPPQHGLESSVFDGSHAADAPRSASPASFEPADRTLNPLDAFELPTSANGAPYIQDVPLNQSQVEQEARNFRVLCAKAPLAICEFDRNGHMVHWNQQLLDMAGIEASDHVMKHWLDIIHPDDLPWLLEDWPNHVMTSHEYRLLTPHRGLRWVRAVVTTTQWDSDGQPAGYIATVMDVTDQKAVEASLRESARVLEASVAQEQAERMHAERERQQFASLVENTADLIALADFKGRLSYMNAAGRALVGLSPDENVAAYTLADFRSPTAYPHGWENELTSVGATGRFVGEGQLVNRQTGKSVDVLVNAFLLRDPQTDQPTHIAVVKRDISEFKRIDESVRLSEERFRQLADNIDEVFWILDIVTNKILYVSPAYSRIWGLSRESAYNNMFSFLDLVHPDDRSKTQEALSSMGQAEFQQEFRVLRTDGSLRTVLVRSFPIRDALGKVYRIGGITQDITDRKQAEEDLLAEQRFLEHLLHLQERERRLVAYDIHDGFVQTVTAAKMHLEGLAVDPEVRERTLAKLSEPLLLLQESIDEARRMISGLRPPIIDEQGLVAAIDYLIHESTGRGSKTKVLFKHDVQFTRLEGVVEGTLFRIVQEALSNVHRHSQARLAEVSLLELDGQLTLIVSDSGIGFDVDGVASRRYGLRGIRERTRLFGGKCAIQSTPGLGTRITVELPVATLLSHATNGP